MKRICSLLLTFAMVFSIPALAFAASDKDYTISEAYWDDGDNKLTARWDEPEDTTSYKVQIYKGSNKVGSSHTTSKEYYDITSIVIEKGIGTYYFTVYPSKGGSDMMVTSEKLYVDSSYLSDMKTAYKERTANTTSSSPASTLTGSASGWYAVNDIWYYIDASGNPVVGWLSYNSAWYYLDASGAMQTGWTLLDGIWYYFGTDGAMVTGWNYINEKWYYFNANGNLLVNTIIDNYIVDSSGAWVQ